MDTMSGCEGKLPRAHEIKRAAIRPSYDPEWLWLSVDGFRSQLSITGVISSVYRLHRTKGEENLPIRVILAKRNNANCPLLSVGIFGIVGVWLSPAKTRNIKGKASIVAEWSVPTKLAVFLDVSLRQKEIDVRKKIALKPNNIILCLLVCGERIIWIIPDVYNGCRTFGKHR